MDYIKREYLYDKFDRVMSMQYYLSTNPLDILESYQYKYDKNSNTDWKNNRKKLEIWFLPVWKTLKKVRQRISTRYVIDWRKNIEL